MERKESMIRKIAMVAVVGMLASCEGGTIPEPVVSSVTLQVVTDVPSSITRYDEILGGSEAVKMYTSLNEMASEICRKGHRKRHELVSSKRIPGQYYYIDEFLFLCLNE